MAPPHPKKGRLPGAEPRFFNPGRQTSPIYAKVWKLAGLKGKPPPVYEADLSDLRAWGIQPNRNREVYLDPDVTRGIQTLPFSTGPNYAALGTLLHEYAHVRQPDMQRRKWIEGGAETWSNRHTLPIAKKLGLAWKPEMSTAFAANWGGASYPKFSWGVFQRPDAQHFIERGQFGRR